MSAKVFFFSDPHFGHHNMAVKRGFKDAIEMGEYIVECWNSVVRKGDTVYMLGDITMEKSTEYYWLDRLKGFKKVILGNHDKPQHVPELLKYVNSVAGMVKYKDRTFGNIFLTHCPIHPKELDYRVSFNVHGHVHENSIEDDKYINVSCEAIGYAPKTLEELIKK
jgi:calcineurin-like phosphoesterase family protein